MAQATADSLFGARRSSRRIVDAALAAVAFGGTLALFAHGGFGGSGASVRHLDLLGVVLAGCASLPLLIWRRSPVGVFATMIIASAGLMALSYPGAPPLGATIALYLIAATRDEHRPWTRRTTALVIGLFAVHVGAFAIGHGRLPAVQLAIGALVWAVAWFAGERTRLRRHELAELEQRARRNEREAERERRLAIAEERARIARDLHDSAAHAINVIGVQAGAARLLQERDPARSAQALRIVERVAAQTVSEIDQLVRSLREDDPRPGEVEPVPGLAALRTLVAQHRAAGLSVGVATDGSAQRLSSAVDQAAYRILQEALTNCARHGDGSASVSLSFGEDALGLSVTNALSGEAGQRSNGGHGLVGMRERALLLGGELEAGADDGVFRIRARLPYGGSAA